MLKKINKKDVIVIMAADSGFSYEGFLSEGYSVFTSYRPVDIKERIMREVCFRVPMLPKKIWYNKSVLNKAPKYIIIRDAVITKKYLKWLQKNFPNAQINFMYENMIGNARHLQPNKIPEGIRIWTFDEYDSEKYGIHLKKTSSYFQAFVKPKQDPKYDLLFVGKDKGRGDWLIKLEKYLKKKGIKTKFIITADGKFSKKKVYYQDEVPYETITELIARSKAVLNVTMRNQRGITVRDLECLFNKVKLVTTNKYIVNADFYNKNNIFIIKRDDWKDIPKFIQGEYDDSQPIDMSLHSIDSMVAEMIAYD